MIAHIRGELAATEVDTVVVENNGIGYEIYVPASVYPKLPAIGQAVKFYTYLNVKEDAMQLYGFLEKDDLEMFRQLITVSGIGPKGALGVLAAITPDELRFAILSEDSKTISKAPGIGAKTAKKLILDLKDKLRLEDAFEKKLAHTAGEVGGLDALGERKQEAVEALAALGYSGTESLQAVRRVELEEGMTTEDILKLALKKMLQ